MGPIAILFKGCDIILNAPFHKTTAILITLVNNTRQKHNREDIPLSEAMATSGPARLC